MDLKELRIEKKLTQVEAAHIVEISLRSYKSYENESVKKNSIKYNYIMDLLSQYNIIDETHGILELNDIRNTVIKICESNDIEYCYLFGSYAKGNANELSDVDLLISTNITGLKFYSLVEELRGKLHKKVDVLDLNQLNNNFELVKEILRDGIKIYDSKLY